MSVVYWLVRWDGKLMVGGSNPTSGNSFYFRNKIYTLNKKNNCMFSRGCSIAGNINAFKIARSEIEAGVRKRLSKTR